MLILETLWFSMNSGNHIETSIFIRSILKKAHVVLNLILEEDFNISFDFYTHSVTLAYNKVVFAINLTAFLLRLKK